MSSQAKVIDLDVIEAQYAQFVGRRYIFLLVLALMTVALAGTAVTLGVIKLSIGQVYEVIFHNFLPDQFQATEEAQRVVWSIRLPRILFGILAGMGLGIAGAVMQVVLKNPLASPLYPGHLFGCRIRSCYGHTPGPGIFRKLSHSRKCLRVRTNIIDGNRGNSQT